MGTSQRQHLACVACLAVRVGRTGLCTVVVVFTKVVCLPEPFLDRLPVERVSGDLAELHPSTRTQHCTAVAAGFLTASTLQWPSGFASVDFDLG